MIKVDDGWVVQNTTYRKLYVAGYAIAGYTQISQKTGESRHAYVLSNKETKEILLDTEDVDKINQFVRLLIGSES